jgi:glycosyltransferase involved in cell wall biosynthesis
LAKAGLCSIIQLTRHLFHSHVAKYQPDSPPVNNVPLATRQSSHARGDSIASPDDINCGFMANASTRPMSTRRMKLAILGSRGFPSTYGGYETLVRHVAPYLVRAGHEVTVYCRTRDERQRTWITEDVRCIATPGRDTKSLSTLTFGMTATLDASFRRFDSMLVLNIANGFWFPILRAARTPFAVNTDGIEWERGKWSRLGRAAFRAGAWMTARSADALICDSRAIGAVWKTTFGRESTFIPYGAQVLSDVGRDRLDAMNLGGSPYLLVVARLAPENNVDLTLDAIELLGDQVPQAVIVGSANFDSPIEARLRKMETAGRVSWLGHVNDQQLLTQLWAHSAVYVHGHSVGGTNPALLQALGAGAPTLALDTPFNAEVLPFSEQRFPQDARMLADQIQSAITSPSLQKEMAQRGRSVVHERYSWDDVCRAYMDVLLRLASC